MIVSHKHRFIFIKTHKTAGTSVEIGLSQFCGEDDIVTEISPEDEETRRSLGFVGPQNHGMPLRYWGVKEWRRRLLKRRSVQIRNHTPAWRVRKLVGSEIWRDYFTFTIERNPWDKVVSFYFWECRANPNRTLSDYLARVDLRRLSDFDLYTVGGEPIVDRVIQFSELQSGMDGVCRDLGICDSIELPRAKGRFRTDKKPYTELLDAAQRERIEQAFDREIAHFGYTF